MRALRRPRANAHDPANAATVSSGSSQDRMPTVSAAVCTPSKRERAVLNHCDSSICTTRESAARESAKSGLKLASVDRTCSSTSAICSTMRLPPSSARWASRRIVS